VKAVERSASIKEKQAMKLQINESPIDRATRIVVGLALVAVGVAGVATAPVLYATSVVAAVLLVTGVVGFCPLYAVLRFSTAPARR
jgi:Flp pilus assembly protein TadB